MVPNGWKATQIGEVANFFSGGTPSKQNANFWGGGEPWISGKDLKSHYLEGSVDTLTKEGFEVAKKAPKGASLILVRGMTLLKDFPVGYATREMAFNQDIKALVPEAGVDGLFLAFMLVSHKENIRQIVSTAGHGTGRLDTSLVKEYPVNLPPLAEQKEIACILSTWGEAITTTERLIEVSQQQKNALMQHLLTGKRRMPGFESEWRAVPIGSLFRKVSRPVAWDDNFLYPLVSVRRRSGGVFLRESLYGREIKTKNLSIIKSGDFLISKMQVVHGALSKVASGYDGCYVSGSYVILRPKDDACVSVDFFDWLSRTGRVYNMTYLCSYGVHIEKMTFNVDLFLKEEVCIPVDVEEQNTIAKVLSHADEQIEALQRRLDCLRQEKKALMQQLLTGKRRVKVEATAPTEEAAC